MGRSQAQLQSLAEQDLQVPAPAVPAMCFELRRFAWIPGVGMLLVDHASEGEVAFMGFLLALVWVMLVILAAQEFRNTRRLEARVADLLNDNAA